LDAAPIVVRSNGRTIGASGACAGRLHQVGRLNGTSRRRKLSDGVKIARGTNAQLSTNKEGCHTCKRVTWSLEAGEGPLRTKRETKIIGKNQNNLSKDNKTKVESGKRYQAIEQDTRSKQKR